MQRTAGVRVGLLPLALLMLSDLVALGALGAESGRASALAPSADPSPAAIRELSERDAVAAAETLWQIAVRGRLSPELAAIAGDLLDHDDPFARGLAEWAIATKVGMENGGQEIVWPGADPPPWFCRWSALTPQALLEADYVRFAVVWNIHRDGQKLLDSVGAILRRAKGAAAEVPATAPAQTRAMVARQLAEIESIRSRLAERLRTAPDDVAGHRGLWLAARRAARPIVMANPALDFHQLAFLMRHPAHSHRNITGSQYPWVHKPGGDLCVKEELDPASPVRGVIAGQLGPGHVHGWDLCWDADRAVFAYARQPHWPPPYDAVHGDCSFELRKSQEPTHLYEIGMDGSGLRQLTDDPYWSDLEPTYCANGEVVFASDRSGRSSECGKFSADHTVINLYGLMPDGRIRRLNDNKDIDRYPHSLQNGLVAYTRWEYQERHFFEVHAMWQIRPDGTMADALFKQHLPAPYGLRDTRSVVGSKKLVAIATGHHTFAYGPVVVIDPRRGINAVDGIRVVTPGVLPQEGPMAGARVDEGGVPDQGGLYQTPWALSGRCFLVSYSYGRPPSDTAGGRNEHGFAIYFIDVHGNKELIHRDLILSCDSPIPLRARPRPMALPDHTAAAADATCYVADVYQGLEGVPRGSVKHLRILQRVGWPLDEKVGAMRWIPGNAWEKHLGFTEWAPVRVIGTVRVAADGSAAFKVPADTSVYFQALDENFMELRRMRTHVTLQPGEVRGCTGCHESQLRTPSHAWTARQALAAEPQVPEPPPWGSQKLLGYEWLVQPIFDRHCVRCHGADQPAGNIDLSARRAEDGFLQSFCTLFGLPADGVALAIGKPGVAPGAKSPARALVSCSDRFSGAEVTQPLQFGSHRSPLVRVLLDDELHRKESALDPPEWQALVTWVDANAPYYDTFYDKRPADGGPPRRDVRRELPPPFVTQAEPRRNTMP